MVRSGVGMGTGDWNGSSQVTDWWENLGIYNIVNYVWICVRSHVHAIKKINNK